MKIFVDHKPIHQNLTGNAENIQRPNVKVSKGLSDKHSNIIFIVKFPFLKIVK